MKTCKFADWPHFVPPIVNLTQFNAPQVDSNDATFASMYVYIVLDVVLCVLQARFCDSGLAWFGRKVKPASFSDLEKVSRLIQRVQVLFPNDLVQGVN